MKIKSKILGFIVAALLLFGIAGQAMAYFEEYELIRVVYEKNGSSEVGTDLLYSASSLTSSSALTGTVVFDDNNFTKFGNSTNWSDYYVVYYAISKTTSDVWLSGTEDGLTSGNRQGTSVLNALTLVSNLYGSKSTALATILQSASNSLVSKSSIVTNFASSDTTYATSLADLATVGYVDQILYYFDSVNTVAAGVAVATLRTFADGHTELMPVSSVPVPAALYLLGSGLVALVGIRRRMVAA
jgi:hypothetical protein